MRMISICAEKYAIYENYIERQLGLGLKKILRKYFFT